VGGRRRRPAVDATRARAWHGFAVHSLELPRRGAMGNASCLEGVRGASGLSKPFRPVPVTPKVGFKVCVCGGAGNLGQPLCMLAALDPLVSELAVYDRAISMLPPEGIAKDLDHIERRCRVKAYSLTSIKKEVDHLEECLTGCHLVLACVGVPIQGKTKEELVKYNGSMVKSIVEACAKFCPNAVVGLIVNPVTAVVPAMAKLYEKSGLDPLKICGITTLDVLRANKFAAEETGVPVELFRVPVAGGHSGHTNSASSLPLFSQDPVAARIPEARRAAFLQSVQELSAESSGTGASSRGKGAMLSQAYAAWRFGKAVLSGLAGEKTDEFCFLKSDACPGVSFFASKVTFGPAGVEKIHPIGKISSAEQATLERIKAELVQDIQDGFDYAEKTELSGGTPTSPVSKV